MIPICSNAWVNRLEDLRVPTIAAMNGGVYGGATDLALACDFRIGVHGMRMFMPAARLGIVYYEGGLRRYVTRLGLNNAKRLFLTAATMEADDLLRMGFVSELVEPEQLDETVDALATQIAGNAPLAVAALKAALNDVAAGTLDPEAHARRARPLRELAGPSRGGCGLAGKTQAGVRWSLTSIRLGTRFWRTSMAPPDNRPARDRHPIGSGNNA